MWSPSCAHADPLVRYCRSPSPFACAIYLRGRIQLFTAQLFSLRANVYSRVILLGIVILVVARLGNMTMRFLESVAGGMMPARSSPNRKRKQVSAIVTTFKRGLICMTPKKEEHASAFLALSLRH